jgi:hypothetical protein
MRIVQAAAPLLRASGLDRFLSRRRNFWVRHFWSLFAVYDVDRMIMFGKPWWTYEAIDDVEKFLEDKDGKARVFEYGAGASTVWLAPRSGEVHSVEHDGGFVDVLRPKLAEADNVWLHHVAAAPRRPDSTAVSEHASDEAYDFRTYADTITQVGGEFDLIIVDGRARVTCLETAMSHLAPGGIILFDDAQRERYAAGLERCGLDVNRKRGLAPSVPLPETTALLRSRAS